MSAIAGVLVAASVTPSVAVAGIAANQTIGIFEGLPEYLEPDKLSEKSNIYATNADGSNVLLASFYDQNRVEMPWDQISVYAKDAAVAGEDPRFYEHGGVDIQGTARAIIQTYVMKSGTQGGSSITQQYVKNILIENAVRTASTQEEQDAAVEAATAPSESRKIREMKLAIGLEKEYTKDQILLGYLNIAYFGGNTYGIESAANYYFNTTAANLNIPQAASLLAIVNNPDSLRIDQPGNEVNGEADGYSRNKGRRDYILNAMLDEGKITAEEHASAIASTVYPIITEPSTGCSTAAGAGFFCDYVTKIFQNNPIFGEDEDTRWLNFKRGGFDVYTSLDLDLQRAAENAITTYIPATSPAFNVGGVAVSVQPGTGRVLAMAQNRSYSQDPDVLAADPAATAINYNTDFAYGGSSGFQPGSTYKLFTLLEWLKEGHSLNESVDARIRSNWGTFRDSCADGGYVGSTGWAPKNDDFSNGGVWTAAYNTATSQNSGFVAMAKELDLCEIRNGAQAVGVHRADGNELGKYPSDVLGTQEIAPVSMASAYAAVAAGGMYCAPIAIDKVVAADGTEQPVPTADCHQAIEPNVAATAIVALRGTFASGGTATASATGDGIPLIGKTGTTDGAKDTWMTGASTKVATVVGVVAVTGEANQRGVRGWNGGTAATARHRVWPAIMKVANAKYGGDAFPESDGSLLQVPSVSIPDVRGKTLAEASSIIADAGFSPIDGGTQDSTLPAGQVSSTNPSGSAARGSAVSIYTSNGNGDKVTLPDVLGRTLEEAKAAYAGIGFAQVTLKCTVDPAAPDAGLVVGQNPAPGTQVAKNSNPVLGVKLKQC